jgi:hypothetical protein
MAQLLPSATGTAASIESWRVAERRRLESMGIDPIEERTIDYSAGQFVSVGGNLLQTIKQVPNLGFVSVECRSTGRLVFDFAGFRVDLSSFYDVVAGVHNVRP